MPKSKPAARHSPILTRKFARNLFQSLSKAKPQTTNMGGNGNDLVKHSLISSSADIPKFSGLPDSIDLNSYIKRVETLYTTRGHDQDESLKISCFKENIDQTKGTARNVILFPDLDELKTYAEYLKEFRKHFQDKSDTDPLRAMLKLLKTKQESSEEQTAFISRVGVQCKDFETILQNSQLVDSTDKTKIDVHKIALLMTQGLVIQEQRPVLQERLFKDMKNNTGLREIDCLLKGYAQLDPSVTQYVLPAHRDESREGRSQTRNSYRGRSNTPYRGRSSSRGPRYNSNRYNIECYKCHKRGHVANECYSGDTCDNCQRKGHNERVCKSRPWCNHHRMTGHKTEDCRAKQNFREGQKDETEKT